MEPNERAAKAAPPLTHQEICAFALTLAHEEQIEDPAKLALLSHPEQTPLREEDELLFCWYEDYLYRAEYFILHPESQEPEDDPEVIYDSRTIPPQKQPKPQRYPHPPRPARREIHEFARVLAFDKGDTNRNLLRLIAWWAGETNPPLKMTEKTFQKHIWTAQAYWEQASDQLTERMKQDYRRRLRRQHREKQRSKQRAYRWTRRPPTRANTQSRSTTQSPRSTSPPNFFPPVEALPPHPYRCPRETLLCYSGGGPRPAFSANGITDFRYMP